MASCTQGDALRAELASLRESLHDAQAGQRDLQLRLTQQVWGEDGDSARCVPSGHFIALLRATIKRSLCA